MPKHIISMKHKLLSLSAFIAMLTLFCSSCSKVPSSASLIPKDASTIVRIDVKQIAEKADDGDEEWKKQLKEEIKKADMSRKATDLLLAIVDKPKKLGLDLRDPVFVYMRPLAQPGFTYQEDTPGDVEFADSTGDYQDSDTREPDTLTDEGEEAMGNPLADIVNNDDEGDMEYGVVMTMYDIDDFNEVIDALKKEMELQPRHEADMHYIFMDAAIMAYDDHHLLILGRNPGESEAQLKARAHRQLKQDKDESIADNDFFRTMCKSDGDVQVLWLGQSVATNPVYASLMAMMMPAECKLADIASLTDCDMKKGETLITSQLLTDSKAWDKQIEAWLETSAPINGDFSQYVDDDDDVVMACNLNGEKMVELIESMPMAKMFPREVKKDLFAMLGSMQGDGMIGMSLNAKTLEPEHLHSYSKVKDSSVLQLIVDNIFEGEAQHKGTNHYRISADSTEIDLGWKEGVLYLSMGNEQPFAKAKKPFDSKTTEDKKLYFRLNFNLFEKLRAHPSANMEGSDLIIFHLLSKFESMEMYAEDKPTFYIRVISKDKEKTLLGIVTHFFTHLGEEVVNMFSTIPPADDFMNDSTALNE